MIKLTLNSGAHSKQFSFAKDSIIIGEGLNDLVDISLPGLGLHQNHLKIILKGSFYLLVNQANDPFVTLNGLPFGKKKLKPNDKLQIRDQLITIDEISVLEVKEEAVPQKIVPLETTPSAPQIVKEAAPAPLPLEQQLSDFPDSETLAKEDDLEGWFPADISDLSNEYRSLEEKNKTAPSNSAPSEAKPSLDDIYADEGVFEKKAKNQFSAPKSFSLKGLRWIGLFIFLFFAIFGAIAMEIYFRAKNESGGEEIKAAESLADFAMALTYAHIYHIVPQKQNFSDPEFLKNNLTALLSSTSISCGNIDAQGQFSNCPYILRFYSNQDLSRFLLIAQPGPSLSQWLFPKDAILIDSSLMYLRKIADLKAINRLLANSNPFEGSNGVELQEVIKGLEILPLSYLAQSSLKKEFSPPSILGFIRPGAENLVYNAPRYYLFGEMLLKKVASSWDAVSSQESMLQSEIEKLAKFENLVFYTPHGMQAAYKAGSIFSKLMPHNSFLMADLTLSPQGKILNSRLIIHEIETSGESKPAEPGKEIAEAEVAEDRVDEENDPIFLTLEAFRDSCRRLLLPIIQRMSALLEQGLEIQDFEISQDFTRLLDKYERTKKEQQEKLLYLLHEIKVGYPDFPDSILESYLRQNELDQLVERKESKEKQAGIFNPKDFIDPLLVLPQIANPPFLEKPAQDKGQLPPLR